MITFTWKVLEIKKGLIIIFLNNGVKEEVILLFLE